MLTIGAVMSSPAQRRNVPRPLTAKLPGSVPLILNREPPPLVGTASHVSVFSLAVGPPPPAGQRSVRVSHAGTRQSTRGLRLTLQLDQAARAIQLQLGVCLAL